MVCAQMHPERIDHSDCNQIPHMAGGSERDDGRGGIGGAGVIELVVGSARSRYGKKPLLMLICNGCVCSAIADQY